MLTPIILFLGYMGLLELWGPKYWRSNPTTKKQLYIDIFIITYTISLLIFLCYSIRNGDSGAVWAGEPAFEP